jgi:hypothetical protein
LPDDIVSLHCKQYKQLKIKGFTVISTMKDGVVLLQGGEIAVVKNIVSYAGEIYIVYNQFLRKRSLYNFPLPSEEIHVIIVSKLDNQCRKALYSMISGKCVCMPMKDGSEFAILPFAHSD